MRIIFMGTPEFAVPSLRLLVEKGYAPVAVVTGPDRERGRGQQMMPTPVKETAQELSIERILQPTSVKSDAFTEEVAALEPDVIAVAAFKILPPAIFSQAAQGAFNLHSSLLPKYRGAAPIHRAVMDGVAETGVTTFFLKESVDTGDVILQRTTPVGPNETAGEVHDRLKEIGAEAVVETVRRIEDGTAEAMPQDDAEASAAPKLEAEDGQVPWKKSAQAVHDHIRGLSPWPGAWTRHSSDRGATRLKLYRSRLPEDAAALPEGNAPGTVLEASGRLVVACGEDAVELVEVQRPGKTVLPAEDFLNGYALEPGDRLGT
jgi:methionyl-tRNA formyltransferase